MKACLIPRPSVLCLHIKRRNSYDSKIIPIVPVLNDNHNMADTAGVSAPIVENVAELQFGQEFEDIHILSNAQVAVILQVSASSAVTRDEELNEVYRKTQKYVNRFNTMMNVEKDHQELVDELDNLQEYVQREGKYWLGHGSHCVCFYFFVLQSTDKLSKRN